MASEETAEERVRSAMQRAYWDSVVANLTAGNFSPVVGLVEELRDGIVSTVPVRLPDDAVSRGIRTEMELCDNR
jgi:hypothetical protein